MGLIPRNVICMACKFQGKIEAHDTVGVVPSRDIFKLLGKTTEGYIILRCPSCGSELRVDSLKVLSSRQMVGYPIKEPKHDPGNHLGQAQEFELSKRVPCREGTCIGTINEKGVCNICGKPYSVEIKTKQHPKSIYKKWTTENLIKATTIDKADYVPYAISKMKQELQARGINEDGISKYPEEPPQEEIKDEEMEVKIAKWKKQHFQEREIPAVPETSAPHDVKKVSSLKKFVQDIFLSLFGLITSLLTALIIVFVELKLNIVIYSFSVWFVIPIGAFFSGFAAASGYYFASKLFNHKPGGILLLNTILISIGTFFFIHYLVYSSIVYKGRFISSYVPFSTYLDAAITHASMRSLKSKATTGELGSLGYVVAILQVLGFSFGGMCVFGWLSSLLYCDRCSKYFSSKGKQERFFSDIETVGDQYEIMRGYIQSDKPREAIKNHAIEGNEGRWDIDKLRTRIEISHCKSCQRHHLKYSVSKLKNDDWKDIDDLKLEMFTEKLLFLK